MLIRGGLKPESFISAIACTIAGDTHARKDAEDLTRVRIEAGDGAIYLAGGYWRAIPEWDHEDRLIGVRLVNPDRTAAECRAVEQGIAILRHLEQQEPQA